MFHCFRNPCISNVGAQTLFERRTFGIHAKHLRETCLKQCLTVADLTCKENDGNIQRLGLLQNSEWKFTHKRLTVGTAFSGYNKTFLTFT